MIGGSKTGRMDEDRKDEKDRRGVVGSKHCPAGEQ